MIFVNIEIYSYVFIIALFEIIHIDIIKHKFELSFDLN